MDTVVTDAYGKVLAVGSRVKLYGYHEDLDRRRADLSQGVVESISDPDGDVDDYGRSIQIPPLVTILFDSDETDEFHTHSNARHYMDEDYTWQCDDVEKIG